MAFSSTDVRTKIGGVGVTTDSLADRGGLALFARYVTSVAELNPLLERLFGSIRKSRKGLPVLELFKQLFCFFMDGTSFHLTRFDELAQDAGYAGCIETAQENLASTHQVKRFFRAFSFARNFLFRRVLQWFFLWRLKIRRPAAVLLNLDTMVMNNDDALVREGVQPTYKKVKGFQPLQLTWERFIVDAVLRGGKKHSNHGDTVAQMLRHIVRIIREGYRQDVPIVLRTDGGFFDEANFEVYDELGIGFVCGGKLYADIGEFMLQCPPSMWRVYGHKKQQWEVLEFGDRRKSWSRFRRALFCRPLSEDGQCLFEFARPDTVLYTNLGMGRTLDDALMQAGCGDWLTQEGVLNLAHGRGADELVHRALKDFGTEQLPFKRSQYNAAFYYVMVLAFNLFEAFKEDVSSDVVPMTSYATTVRRQIIDVAAKVVRTSGQVILKLTQATYERLSFHELWDRANSPPLPALA
jgi:hypothetical protein